jgi:hypothetical protein
MPISPNVFVEVCVRETNRNGGALRHLPAGGHPRPTECELVQQSFANGTLPPFLEFHLVIVIVRNYPFGKAGFDTLR